MSLLLRLPLNGTLENKGLNLSEIINNGATIDSSGINGSCYYFNGSNSYISISNIESVFTGGSNPFSLSFWLYHSGNSRRGVIFGNYGLLDSNRFNLEIKADNTLRFWWDGSPDWIISTFTIPTQTWIHCVIVYDGTNVKIYKNNQLVYSNTYTLSTKTPSGLYRIGMDSRTGATAFNGKINDFRVYNHALSLKEISEIYNSINLICHYPFNDPYIFQNIIYDCVLNNNGTLNGLVLVLSVNKKYHYCTKFTGTLYVSIDSLPVTPKSFSFWIKVDSKPSGNSVIFADGMSKLAFGFYTSGTKIISSAGASRSVQTLDNKFIYGNYWNHVVVLAENTSVSADVYVNGLKLTNTSLTNNWTHNVNQLYIGARNNGAVATYGTFAILDFRSYDKMLSLDEINEMIHIPINLDNKGNLFLSEINEMEYSDKVSLNQYGQIISKNIKEDTLSGKLASITKSGDIIVNQIKEK